ncbi:MAG: hypothetical protein CMN25_02880 [Salinicola sp.]|uniref:hypothetical protein n=1 Tax=Salinicola sp. TaxID=1978524 RepID=UPI000C8984C8|nr:hypothetical protein [Salinicola sp.]MAM56260.1 hypothetical protein [Salinicola sp.]NRB55729.1 hypothetical protein [Salinicola sp.]|tara:strand:- start:650 stop:991 length:342 start_codon:yes stop_codon:yes gene_type:complete
MFTWLRTTTITLCLALASVAQASAQESEPPPPWPAKAIEASQAQCRANITASGIEGPKVERYCECATKALQARFSAAEVRKMQRDYDPGDREDSRPPELDKTLDQCSPVLESQ